MRGVRSEHGTNTDSTEGTATLEDSRSIDLGVGICALAWTVGLLAAILVALAIWMPAQASAATCVYSDVNDMDMNESPRNFGTYGFSQCGKGNVFFRWLDDPNHTTVIGINYVGSGAPPPSRTQAIPAHRTNYYFISSLRYDLGYRIFDLWGRVAIGAGGMYNHDGRIDR